MKICVLALLVERIAELECGQSWHQIRKALDTLQVTELFDLNCRVLMRNEMPTASRNILKKLKITLPKQILSLEKQPEK